MERTTVRSTAEDRYGGQGQSWNAGPGGAGAEGAGAEGDNSDESDGRI